MLLVLEIFVESSSLLLGCRNFISFFLQMFLDLIAFEVLANFGTMLVVIVSQQLAVVLRVRVANFDHADVRNDFLEIGLRNQTQLLQLVEPTRLVTLMQLPLSRVLHGYCKFLGC